MQRIVLGFCSGGDKGTSVAGCAEQILRGAAVIAQPHLHCRSRSVRLHARKYRVDMATLLPGITAKRRLGNNQRAKGFAV